MPPCVVTGTRSRSQSFSSRDTSSVVFGRTTARGFGAALPAVSVK